MQKVKSEEYSLEGIDYQLTKKEISNTKISRYVYLRWSK